MELLLLWELYSCYSQAVGLSQFVSGAWRGRNCPVLAGQEKGNLPHLSEIFIHTNSKGCWLKRTRESIS